MIRGAGVALLLRELRAHRGALVRVGLWSTVEALPALLTGLMVAAAVERAQAGAVGAALGHLAVLLAAIAASAFAARQGFPWLAQVVEPVRDAFLAAVAGGAVTKAVNSPQHRDTSGVARLTGQVQSVRGLLASLLRTVRQTVFSFGAALLGLIALAPVVASGTVVLAVLALTLFGLFIPGLVRRHRAVLLAYEDTARQAGTVFGGIRDAIACAAAERAVADVGRAVDEEVRQTRRMAWATSARILVVFIGGQLPAILLLAAAPWLLSSGRLTVAQLIGSATYLTVSLEPALRSLVSIAGGWGMDLVVTLGRLGEEFAEPDPPHGPAGSVGWRPSGYDLVIRDLTFAYGPHAAPVVERFDLEVPENDHLAIVGPSGIGKSTLANLLAGLLVPQRGEVYLGGVGIRGWNEAELRRQLALIPQEAYVFGGTVRENLAYLAAEASDGHLIRAAEAIGLHPVINRLGGLDAVISAGADELSTGERQLVALARVYASPARIVVLDEATSSLDPAAEVRVEQAFASRGGTLLVIAHRISSARRARRLLLFDGDRIQLGTHDELLRQSALYADLVGHWELVDRIDVALTH